MKEFLFARQTFIARITCMKFISSQRETYVILQQRTRKAKSLTMLQWIKNLFCFTFIATHTVSVKCQPLKITSSCFHHFYWHSCTTCRPTSTTSCSITQYQTNLPHTPCCVLTVYLLSVHAFDLRLHVLSQTPSLSHTHIRSHNRVGCS